MLLASLNSTSRAFAAELVPAAKNRVAGVIGDPTAGVLPLFPKLRSAVKASLEDALIVTVRSIASKANGSLPSIGRDKFIEAVRNAVLTHPSVGQALVDFHVSASASRELYSGFLPQVSGTGDVGYRSIGVNAPTDFNVQKGRSPNLGVTVRQLLYDFNSTVNAYDAGLARQKQAKAELEGARSEYTMRAITAYVDLLRMRSHNILAEQSVSSRRALRDQVSERARSGGGSEADVTRAEARYIESLANVASVANKLRAAEGQFAEVFGIEAPIELPLPIDPDLRNADKPLSELLALYSPAQSREAARLAAELDAEASKSKMLPRLNAELSHSRRNWDNLSVGRSGSDTTAVLSLRYDFYTGGADTARREQAAYRAGKAALELELVKRQFDRGLSQARSDVKNSDLIREARIRSANAAVRSMEAVQEQFKFNRGSLLDTIKTQEELYTAGKDMIDAVADRLISRYRLLFFTSQLDQLFKIGNIAEMPKDILLGATPPSKVEKTSIKASGNKPRAQ